MAIPSDRSSDRAVFESLHLPGQPVVLPNAWDVISAVLIEKAGAPAIATTSAGLAWSLGYADGNQLPVKTLLKTIATIRKVVGVPLTVDIEGGYDRAIDKVVDLVGALFEAGAVGVNLEDSWDGRLLGAQEQANRVRLIATSVPGIFVNARVDTYLLRQGAIDDLAVETLARANLVVAAGAHGVFLPGLSDLGVLASLIEKLDVPVNVMAGPGSPSVAEFSSVGVARISTGASLAQSAYGFAFLAAQRMGSMGIFDDLTEVIDYNDMNQHFAHQGLESGHA